MVSKILYKDESLDLCEDFIDIGYMAENFEASDLSDNLVEVRRSHPDKSMSLFISFPNKEEFRSEILKLDKFLSNLKVDVNCYLIFTKKNNLVNELSSLVPIYDSEDEFGSMYGTKIQSGSLEGDLTKSLFLISKDGAVFYFDMPEELTKEINLERLQGELNRAYVSYTGVGCHG
ncbi:MAG: hypothetical protein OIF32_12830 [Campylobacterales bacterium]|nr:hypothetical protein [Campylobacterales bacterium]